MSDERPNPILQQIPLIITPNKFTSTNAVTLPFEYKHDLVVPKIDSKFLKHKISEDSSRLENLKSQFDELESDGSYKKWEQQTLNNVAPGFFGDTVLKPHHQK